MHSKRLLVYTKENIEMHINRKAEELSNKHRIDSIKKFIYRLNNSYKKYNKLKKNKFNFQRCISIGGGISFTTGATAFSLILATGIVVPFILPISIGLSLSSIVCFGLNKVTDVKTRKYRNLETLSQNEFLEVKRIYSKALEDGKISEDEHSFILDVEDKFNQQLKYY